MKNIFITLLAVIVLLTPSVSFDSNLKYLRVASPTESYASATGTETFKKESSGKLPGNRKHLEPKYIRHTEKRIRKNAHTK